MKDGTPQKHILQVKRNQRIDNIEKNSKDSNITSDYNFIRKKTKKREISRLNLLNDSTDSYP